MSWILGALAAAAWYLDRPGAPAEKGQRFGFNALEALASQVGSFDKERFKLELRGEAARAEAAAELIKERPALGSFLGWTPQQVDYLTLPREKYDSLYAFNPPTQEGTDA